MMVRTVVTGIWLISRGAALRRRPFPNENRGGCPLTPDLLGRRRPLISWVLGAAPGPFTVASSTRIRSACRPAAPSGNHLSVVGAQGGWGAGGDARQRSDHPASRGLGRGQGRADLLYTGLGPGQLGQAAAGGPDLPDDDPLAAGAGRPVGRAGRDPGGDGGHQRLLERGLLPAGSPRVPDLAGGLPVTSSTCRVVPRPTPWTRSGYASWPSASCCGPASSPTTDP